MSNLYWLSEDQMARLGPYFPKSYGVPRVDDRKHVPMSDYVSYSPIFGQFPALPKLLFAPADRFGFRLFSANRPRLGVCRQGRSVGAFDCRTQSIPRHQLWPLIRSPKHAGRRIRISSSATASRQRYCPLPDSGLLANHERGGTAPCHPLRCG